jgi:hypothetical protein
LKIKNQTHNVGPILEIETKDSPFMNITGERKKTDLQASNLFLGKTRFLSE